MFKTHAMTIALVSIISGCIGYRDDPFYTAPPHGNDDKAIIRERFVYTVYERNSSQEEPIVTKGRQTPDPTPKQEPTKPLTGFQEGSGSAATFAHLRNMNTNDQLEYKKCPRFIMPSFETIPVVPQINKSIMSNDEITKTLVDYIVYLRSYIDAAEGKLAANYKKYTLTCAKR